MDDRTAKRLMMMDGMDGWSEGPRIATADTVKMD